MNMQTGLAIAGSGVGLLAGGIALWPTIGWQTGASHAADVAALQARIEQLEIEFTGAVEKFYDNWQCDEWHEELVDLLKAQRNGDDSVETAERIRILRERIARHNCERFEN